MTEPAKRKLKLNTHRLSTDAELVTANVLAKATAAAVSSTQRHASF
jgi:hypothetical protein